MTEPRHDPTHDSQPTAAERDRRVLALYEQVLEIEQRLIPTGLHVFGRSADDQTSADLLRMIASFDRPEAGARALPDLVAAGLGLDAFQALLADSKSNEQSLRARERVDEIVRDAIARFLHVGADEASAWLEQTAHVPRAESRAIFTLLA